MRSVWDAAPTPNLMISSSDAVALWHVPQALGSYGMRVLEQQRATVWPAVTRHASGGWLFCTRPPSSISEISAVLPQVRLLGNDEPVVVPPSRLPGQNPFWLWAQRFPELPLPSAEPVVSALTSAATDRLAGITGGSDDRPASATWAGPR